MRNAARLSVVLFAVALAAAFGSGQSHADAPPLIEPIVWQLNLDYPETSPPDSALPIDTVYIKTHDGADWMSTYDSHPNAVSGPESIQNLIAIYGAQGIDVAAWFVPKGTDYDAQVAMAIQVIDSGVTALYADLEPFAGFCYRDCASLVINFWTRVRLARPEARLGVIYDPRPWWWGASATSLWFANADVAMPMCYWETFAGQGAYGDPAGCVVQARADLDELSPNRSLEYLPILQGDSTAAAVQTALDASVRAGVSRVSLWRRGVVPNSVWDMIANYQAPSGPHCATQVVDGCVVRDPNQGTVYIVQGGAKFGFPSWDSLIAMGLTGRDIQVLPAGVVDTIPDVPVDGTLLKEFGGETVYVVQGGARFVVPPDGAPAAEAQTARVVPAGGIARLPLAPRDYTIIREQSSAEVFVVFHGQRLPFTDAVAAVLAELGVTDTATRVVPDGGLVQVPALPLVRGDVDCDGAVGVVDVLAVLRGNAGLGSPNLCAGFTGDVTCDGLVLPDDALVVLSYVAESVSAAATGCAPVGDPAVASVSS